MFPSHDPTMTKQPETMPDEIYKIKPFKWEYFEHCEWWELENIFGTMMVEKRGDHYVFRYCIDEYYDEDEIHCNGFEEGKGIAESFYLERLLPSLEKV